MFGANQVLRRADAGYTALASPLNRPLPAGTVGQLYNQAITTNNEGTAPYTFAVTSGTLPSGLALDASTGVVSGAPTTVGTYNFTVTVKDANKDSASESYELTVAAPPRTVGRRP